MYKLLLSCCLLLCVLFFPSCNHYFYQPPEPHALMLSEKGDLKIFAGAGTSSAQDGNFAVQAGWSPVRHLGISGSYFQVGEFNDNNFSGNNDIASNSLEGAVGAYLSQPFKEKTNDRSAAPRNDIVLDVYAGYGRNKNINRFYSGGSATFRSQHTFIQGGLHYQSPFIGLSFILRVVQLDFTEGDVVGNVSDRFLTDIGDLNNDPFTFLESSVRIKAGGPKVKGFISRNWMSPPFNNKRLVYSSSSWHLGFELDLQDIFKKK